MNVILIGLSQINSLDDNNIHCDLMREFVKHGHYVSMYFGVKGEDRKLFTKVKEDRADIYQVNVGRVQKVNPVVKGINFLSLDSKFKKAIKKTYKNESIDLVLYLTPPITLTKTVSFLKKKYKCKSYLLLKDIFPQNSLDLGMLSTKGLKGIIYRYFKKIEKKLYTLSDYIGCMSQANVDYLIDNNSYLDKKIVEVNPNSIDVSRLEYKADDSSEIREEFGIPLDKKVFIYGGNLGRPQNIPFVLKCIKACESIKDAYFTIVGDGTDYRLVEEFVKSKESSNLLSIKRLSNNDYLRLLSACDVGLIFLDYRFTIPNFPSRLLDYMRVGLPIYACTDNNTDIGKTIVDGGFGWWSLSNDVDAFVNNISEITKKKFEGYKAIEHQYLIDHFSSLKAYETIIRHFK